jgi:beta-glucosidase
VNLYRVPQGGRNFEYLGEDPHLASRMVVPYIRAVQDRGVMATVKHFAANNHEWHRKASNSVVDERDAARRCTSLRLRRR